MSPIKSILIVEDDEFKMRSLNDWVSQALPSCRIENQISVSGTVNKLPNDSYDYVLLDMALPARELKVGAGPTDSLLSGGLEVLLELQYLDRREKVVVITQYPEIEIDGSLVPLVDATEFLKKCYYSSVVDCIFYEHDKQEWKHHLSKALS